MRSPALAVVAAAALTAFAAASQPAAADNATFNDPQCPNVNPTGQHLDAILAQSKVLTPDLMATAKAMIDGYLSCMKGYDQQQYQGGSNFGGGAGESQTNAVVVDRIYTRLQVARSLQRVGTYQADAKNDADARASYQQAISYLDQMPQIESLGEISSSSPDARLLREGLQLKTYLQAAIAGLPSADETAPGAASTPSAAPKH
ncbi:MAG: hypothetical protein ACREM2_03845 [Vulcanimicrobiaceae bacterium]